jgi:hypothetical protein
VAEQNLERTSKFLSGWATVGFSGGTSLHGVNLVS